MEGQIKNMYLKRKQKMEIKKMPSDTTIKKHTVNLKKLHKHITGHTEGAETDDIKDLTWTNKELDFIVDKVKSMPGRKSETIGISAQQAYYFSILVGIRSQNFADYEQVELYPKLWEMLQGGFGKDLKDYKKSKENVNLPDFDTVKDLIDNMPISDLKLILTIYKIFPFRLEVADLIFIPTKKAFMKLNKEERSDNYLVKKGSNYFFSFNNYKTGEKYGERRIDVSNMGLKLLLKNKTKGMKQGERLFPDLTRTNMSTQITKFFKDNGLDDMNPTAMTKLIIREAYEQMGPELKKTQERLAKERGHSIQTQLEIYLVE